MHSPVLLPEFWGLGPDSGLQRFLIFLSNNIYQGNKACRSQAINESIKAPWKATASREIENLQRPDLQRDIDSRGDSTWCVLASWRMGRGGEVTVPGKLPSCRCPLTEGAFLMPSPQLVTPGNLVKSKTQCAPSRGSQSEEGHGRNHPSIRYPLSTYYVLDNRHTPSIGVGPWGVVSRA